MKKGNLSEIEKARNLVEDILDALGKELIAMILYRARLNKFIYDMKENKK